MEELSFFVSLRLYSCLHYEPFVTVTLVTFEMDLEDDTTVLTTLKSFNNFVSRPEHPQRLSDHSAGSGFLQSQYKRSIEV